MPEGDTVHKLAAMLGAALRGRTICRVDSRAQLAAVLSGRSLSGVDARGKHLFLRFDGGPALRIHLGLYGSWHRYAVGEPWKKPQRQAGLVLHTDTEVLVCFNPKEVQLIRDGGLIERDLAARLGPDLVDAGVDPARVWRRAREVADPAALLVDVLLDQRVAAGIGNVYKSEVLFLERLHPFALLGQVDDGRLRALFVRAAELMRANLHNGPRITRPRASDGERLWVYGRHARPCLRCGRPVERSRRGRGLRSTYWCPACQQGPAG